MSKSKTSLNELLYDIRRIAEHRQTLTDNKIRSIYRSLMKDLNSYVAEQYTKYADEEGRLYISYLDSKNQRAKFLKEISDNVYNISPKLRTEISNLIDDTYSKSYSGMITALKKADTAGRLAEVTADIAVNSNVLEQAINNNISKLTLPPVMEKHRSEVIYQIQQELNIGLMQGDRYETMAKRVSERLNVSYSKAMNITRTETHRNIESGFMDCAENLQDKFGETGLIYAATWHTMEDNRVRPQQLRKNKKGGWKKTLSKNGANHVKMNGVTVKAGDYFTLDIGVKTKAPSRSGVASQDCNCRCFLEYNLMTAEEFANATGESLKQVINKMPTNENVELQLSNYPSEFTTGAEKKNTQKLIDYINGVEGSDPNVLRLYASTGNLENLSSNGITFKISHAKGHSVQTTSMAGQLKEVKYTIPKLKGENIAGQVNTTLHEQMHLIDLYGREDVSKSGKWFSTGRKELVSTFKNTSDDIGKEVAALFTKHNDEYYKTKERIRSAYKSETEALREKYLPNGQSIWDNLSGYKQYEKEVKKLRTAMANEIDYESRNIMGGGICNLQDIYDALSGGNHRAKGTVIYGHGQKYYSSESNKIVETIANYASLSVTRPDLITMLRKDKPDLCNSLDEMIIALIEKAGI